MKTETKFIPLKFDLLFKKVFGDEKDLIPIKKLLKEILNIESEKITILNSELIGEPYKDKFIRVDLIVELYDGTKVNVEINTNVSKYIVDRNFYYMCRNISKDLNIGEEYKSMHKHIQINFDFEGYHKKPIMTYEMIERETKERLTDLIKIIRIDVPYYTKMCYTKDAKTLDSITKFIGLFGIEEKNIANKLSEGDKDMEDIVKRIEKYSDDDVMGAYNYRLFEKEILEEKIDNAKEQGYENGSQNKTIEIARNMLKENISSDVISKVTNLSIEEINKLAN